MNHSCDRALPNNGYSGDAVQVPRWKRGLDLLCILLALPLLLPLLLFIALIIKLISDGPVLFKQERIGYRGKAFVCLKFRTMAVGADTVIHQKHSITLMDRNCPLVKMDAYDDERLIPLGLQLRASGLDELPQIINVIRGEMSLVGPRPCLRYEFDRYLPKQKERFNALPGLTGLWQVSGKNRTTFDEMIRLDVRYACSQSLWLDLIIMLRTIPALIIQSRDTHRETKRLAASPLAMGGNFPTVVQSADPADEFVGLSSKQLVQCPQEVSK